jgi:hypothetical protein
VIAAGSIASRMAPARAMISGDAIVFSPIYPVSGCPSKRAIAEDDGNGNLLSRELLQIFQGSSVHLKYGRFW